MKHRLLAAIAIAVTAALPLTPVAAPSAAQAVSCDLFGVPVLFPPLPGGVTKVAPWTTYTNPTAAVLCLEQRLVEMGYSINTPDTVYDSTSAAAVKSYQLDRGYHADGVVSPPLMRQMGLRGPIPSGPSVVKYTHMGDSVSAAMRWTDEINSSGASATTRFDIMGTTYDQVWSLESCRRLVATSCSSRTGRYTSERPVPVSVLPLMRTTMAGKMGNALVISAGYDDTSITNAITDIMTEARNQGITRVYWLTYRYDPARSYPYKQYYIKHNQDLQAAKAQWPNLVVLDWNTYSAGQTSWITSDGIHLTATGASAMANFIKTALDGSELGSCTEGDAQAGEFDAATGDPAPPLAIDTGFEGVDPVRMFDSRFAEYGGGDGKLGQGHTVEIDLSAELPPGAESAVVNVTAVKPCARGFLTVFACGERPNTSNVNYVADRTTAGVAISLLTDGTLCVFSSQRTDLIVDLVGAFTDDGDWFHPVQPTRWVDTRGNPAVLSISGQLGTGSQIDIAVADEGDVPSNASAVWINLTATGSPANSVLQVYPGPCGTPPSTSTVNVLGGRSGAVTAIVPLGANGGICVRAFSGTPHVVIDVSGWFGGDETGGLAYHAVTPDRLLDTRPDDVPAAGVAVEVELSATSVVSVAAVDSLGFGFVTAAPCGASGTSSLLNTAQREPVANVGAIAPGTNSEMCLTPSVGTDLIADLVGVFVTPTPG